MMVCSTQPSAEQAEGPSHTGPWLQNKITEMMSELQDAWEQRLLPQARRIDVGYKVGHL